MSAQVMYDQKIKFEGNTFVVNQTWNENTPVVSVEPECDALKEKIVQMLLTKGRLTLVEDFGAWVIAG